MTRVKREGLSRPYEQPAFCLFSGYVNCTSIVGEQNHICKINSGFSVGITCPPLGMGSSVKNRFADKTHVEANKAAPQLSLLRSPVFCRSRLRCPFTVSTVLPGIRPVK